MGYDTLLSPHRAGMFKKCSRQLMYYIMKIPAFDRVTDALLVGKNVHKIIEEYYKICSNNMTDHQIRRNVNDCLQRFILADLGTKNIKKIGAMMENFAKFEIERLKISKKKNINFIPDYVEIELESENFKGIVDMAWNETVYDFKSDKTATIWDKYKIQGSIYFEMLQHETGKEFGIKFVFLRGLDIRELPKPSLEWLYNIKREYDSCIENNYFPPKFGRHCDWCKWKLRCDLQEKNYYMWQIADPVRFMRYGKRMNPLLIQ